MFKKARAQGNLGVRVVEGAGEIPGETFGRALHVGEGKGERREMTGGSHWSAGPGGKRASSR